MNVLRRALLWVGSNAPLGRLNPYIIGLAIGRMPQEEKAVADINDDKPWSKMDDDDLMSEIASGSTAEEAAQFLCRSGTVDDVRKRAEFLGLEFPEAKENAERG